MSDVLRVEEDIAREATARRALSLAERSVQLNPNLAATHAARGYIRALANFPASQVARDFERARELRPNAPSVPRWSARVLATTGHLDSALAETHRAVDLDPYSAFPRIAVALWSLQIGRYQESIEQADRAIALEPDLMLPRAIKGRALLLQGEAERCVDMVLGPHVVIRAMCLRELNRTPGSSSPLCSIPYGGTPSSWLGSPEYEPRSGVGWPIPTTEDRGGTSCIKTMQGASPQTNLPARPRFPPTDLTHYHTST